MIDTTESINKQFLAYMQQIGKELKPISNVFQMTAEEMLNEWSYGNVKDNALVLEVPEWRGSELKSGNPLKIWTAAFSIVSPVGVNDLKRINEIHQECEVLVNQLIARMIEDSNGRKNFMTHAADSTLVEPTIPYNRRTCQGLRTEFDFKTYAKLYIDTKLWH